MGINKEHYYSIQRDYDQKQFQVNYERSKRIEEVFSNIPRLKQIRDSIANLQISKAKNRLNNNAFQLEEVNQQIVDLICEREHLLKEHGYTADYMEPWYECKDCKDTGYTENHEMCHCFKQALIDILYSQSNVKSMLEHNNFQHFNIDLYGEHIIDPSTGVTAKKSMIGTVDYCKTYIDEFDTTFRNLLFYGQTGVGKTFLTNCIAKELLERSYSVLYLSAIDFTNLLSDVMFNFNSLSDESKALSEHIYDCDLLIIDDLGTEISNSVKSSNLFNCLDKRLNNKKSTIISTNLTPKELRNIYSDRIFSRIIGNYSFFKIFGEDNRKKHRH